MNKKMENRRFFSLAFTIPIYIFLISMVFILIFAYMRFHLELKTEINKVNFKIAQIEKTQIDNIELQLWDLNINAVELILQGIVSIDDIICARVIYDSAPKIISAGSFCEDDPDILKKKFKLIFFNNSIGAKERIGELEIFFSIRGIRENVRKNTIAIILEETLQILVVAFVISLIIYILIIHPLNQLSSYAINFDLENMDQTLIFKRRLDFNIKDDIWMVANALNFMRLSLVKATEKLQMNLKIEAELKAASKIQQFSLMEKAPSLPDYEVDFAYIPSRNVSGDFYDIITYDERFIIFIIGDVAGKGIPAGLTAHTSRILIKSRKDLFLKPRQLLSFLNSAMKDEILENSYITLTEAILDRKIDFISFFNAGHLPALLLRKDSDEFLEIKPKGYPISKLHNQYFDEHIETLGINVEDGDFILIYTDGLVDSLYESPGQTGYDKLKKVIIDNRNESLSCIKGKILADTSSSLPERSDDITMLLIRKNI